MKVGEALQQLGNRAADPAEYGALHGESEAALRAAPRLAPGHAGAEGDLDLVRGNRRLRQQ